MIESDRIISASPIRDDAQDRTLRPKRLSEYVGQPVVREQMEIFISAAKSRAEALDHTLIFGLRISTFLKTLGISSLDISAREDSPSRSEEDGDCPVTPLPKFPRSAWIPGWPE